jgi:hypothetical protein
MTTEPGALPQADTPSVMDDEVHAVCLVCNPALEDPIVSLCGDLMTRNLGPDGCLPAESVTCVVCLDLSEKHDDDHYPWDRP